MIERIQLRVVGGLLLGFFFLAGCTEESGYEKYIATTEKEMASGVRADSLFFGISLGMTADEFYGHCWEMNKKGLFTDGEGNTAVMHQFKNNELKYPATMNFYPDFFDGKIYRMRVNYQYDGWAPWNKNMFADSLQLDVLNLYNTWFSGGNPFIKVEDKKKGTIYVKVDGNRRIIIGKFNDSHVKVDFTDLQVEKETRKQDGEK